LADKPVWLICQERLTYKADAVKIIMHETASHMMSD